MPHTHNEADVYALLVGRTVATLRERKGWRQDQLAKLVGIGQPTLSRLERGQTEPGAYVIRRLAAAFDMTPAEFSQIVEDGFAQTADAARSSLRGSSAGSWWEPVIAMAGAGGLAALMTMSVGAVVEKHERNGAAMAHAPQPRPPLPAGDDPESRRSPTLP